MKQSLKGYAQPFRSGMTMKQKWATDRAIQHERKEAEVTAQKRRANVPMMGRNE